MTTERHNLARSMISTATSKTGSLRSCFVCMDMGSNERLAMQNLQIPNTAQYWIVPKWLFTPRFLDKKRFTARMLYWFLPSPQKQKSNRLVMEGGGDSLEWQAGNGEDWEHLSSTTSHQQIHFPQTAPTQRPQHSTT